MNRGNKPSPNIERKLKHFVESNQWKFARTYAKSAPHEYLLRDKVPLEKHKDFYWFANSIKKYGYVEYFWRTPFTYINIDGKKYWAMGEKGKKPNIINRTAVENRY